LSKAANTYLDNSETRDRREAVRPSSATPQAVAFAIIASITFMLCLTINWRAYSEMSREIDENRSLTYEAEILTSENLALQDEIHFLKSDPETIRREARRMGLKKGKSEKGEK
jgi:hypothetical protein